MESSFFNSLNPLPQSLLFTTLKKKPLENIVGKGENAGNQLFHKTNFKFLVTFILSSANAFDLDKPKILSFDNELKRTSYGTFMPNLVDTGPGV